MFNGSACGKSSIGLTRYDSTSQFPKKQKKGTSVQIMPECLSLQRVAHNVIYLHLYKLGICFKNVLYAKLPVSVNIKERFVWH